MSGELAFNPFDRSWWADPYPVYDRLLREAPAGMVGGLPIGYVATFAECEQALRDVRFSADDRHSVILRQLVSLGSTGEEPVAPRSLLRLDAPDHTRLRSLVSSGFTRRAVEQLSSLIESTVAELLGRLPAGVFDVVSELGYPLPVRVVCELLGVGEDSRERFVALSASVAASLDPELTVSPDELAARRAAFAEIRSHVVELLIRARRDGGTPLVEVLLGAVGAGPEAGGATFEEARALLVLLLVAGYETTANLIGNTVLALARHPLLCEQVAADPALVPALVEEVLRTDPPVQLTSRVALEDVEIGGIVVPEGHFLFVLLAAANRDPRQFDRPAAIVLGRPGSRHLAFSSGPHHCLGALLARAEARAVVSSLLARRRRLCLVSEPRYRDTLVLRGLEQLLVEAV